MARYVVRATVTVDVEMSVEADTKDAAKRAFDEHLIMSASLVDVEPGKFDTYEDSITEVADVRIHAEKD